MHREFEDLYQTLYDEFSLNRGWYPRVFRPMFDDLTPRQIRAMVNDTRRAIDAEVASRGVPLRTDAKYFLLVNFVEMVLLPISIVRAQGLYKQGENIITEEQMRNDLQNDVREILNEAVSKKQTQVEELSWAERDKPEHREITSHDVLDAIGSAWNKIKFNEYLYWAG